MAKPKRPDDAPCRSSHGIGGKSSTSIVFGIDHSRPIVTVMEIGDDRYQILGRIAEREMTKDQLVDALRWLAHSIQEVAESL